MKRLLPLLFALTLMGCSVGENLALVNDAFTLRPNPITQDMLTDIEKSATVAFIGLTSYKQFCVRKIIDQSCRGVVERLQVYTRQAKPLLKNLRNFVDNDDQVNAPIAYARVKTLIEDLRRETPTVGGTTWALPPSSP